MNTDQIVTVLDACDGDLKAITPEGMRIAIHSHDTAIHCRIYLTIPGEPELLVWYKTNWHAPAYEFNERGKVIGIQSGCEFARPLLDKLFADAKTALDARKRLAEELTRQQKLSAEDRRAAVLAKYRERFGQAA